VLQTYSSAVVDVGSVIARGRNSSAKFPTVMRGDSLHVSKPRERTVATVIIGLLKRAQAVMAIDARTAAACVERACAMLLAEQHCTASAASSVSAQLGSGGLASFRARAVTAHIETNLGAVVRVADIARVAQLSPSHFTRAFRASFGRSPHAYITQRRLECAMDMMLSTREPLCQIAVVCGFCDQAHFSRHFHRRFGMTPRLWRHQQRKQEHLASAPSAATPDRPPS
jgi:AraC family transcriptional regulator